MPNNELSHLVWMSEPYPHGRGGWMVTCTNPRQLRHRAVLVPDIPGWEAIMWHYVVAVTTELTKPWSFINNVTEC